MKYVLILLLLCLSSVTYADGDIVYSARYYYPPGSKGTSHFQIYRINPNGTGRRQITYGNSEEYDPHWSPDGKHILFVREFFPDEESDGHSSLCCMSADGGSIQVLVDISDSTSGVWQYPRWSPDSHTISIIHTTYQKDSAFSSVYLIDIKSKKSHRLPGISRFEWSPDGKSAVIQNAKGYCLYDLKSASQIAVTGADRFPIWIGNKTLAALGIRAEKDDDYQYNLIVFGRDGREQKRIKLEFPTDLYDGSDPDTLIAMPDQGHIIDAYNNHNSTVGVDYLYFDVKLKVEQIHYFTEGQFLAWSPDGKRFCTAPGRDTVPYEKRRYPFKDAIPNDVEGKYRMVWSAPLFVRATSGGPMRQITPRLSWVTAADWR